MPSNINTSNLASLYQGEFRITMQMLCPDNIDVPDERTVSPKRKTIEMLKEDLASGRGLREPIGVCARDGTPGAFTLIYGANRLIAYQEEFARTLAALHDGTGSEAEVAKYQEVWCILYAGEDNAQLDKQLLIEFENQENLYTPRTKAERALIAIAAKPKALLEDARVEPGEWGLSEDPEAVKSRNRRKNEGVIGGHGAANVPSTPKRDVVLCTAVQAASGMPERTARRQLPELCKRAGIERQRTGKYTEAEAEAALRHLPALIEEWEQAKKPKASTTPPTPPTPTPETTPVLTPDPKPAPKSSKDWVQSEDKKILTAVETWYASVTRHHGANHAKVRAPHTLKKIKEAFDGLMS